MQRRRPPMTLSPVPLNNNSNRPTRQSTRSVPPTPSQCFGCSQPIYNQLISNVLDHLWHPECVRCVACRCLLNEQCYSREGKLYCKDDFIKKYVHRCFACQNLVKSDELIRRIRAGRIYHAECFVCIKCKRTLQDNDISELVKMNDAPLNDLDCTCQTCLHPDKVSNENNASTKTEGNKSIENENSNPINGKISPTTDTLEKKPSTIKNDISSSNHADEEQSMDVDEGPSTAKSSISPVKEQASPSPAVPVQAKVNGRQSKIRQSTGSSGSKRSPAKAKTTPASRQKQTTVTERKGRSPATRSKASAGSSNNASAAQRRSSNRRTTKSTRYRKRSFSSGSDEDESEDDDDDQDDADFTEEDNIQDDEQENAQSHVVKNKSSNNNNNNNIDDKKAEAESKPAVTPQPPTSTSLPPPPATTTNPSLIAQAKMSEPLSLLSGLAANPMSISSIMKPDVTPNFMPAFPTPAQFLPPGFPLQPRLPMPPPPPPPSSSTITNQTAPSVPDLMNRSSNSADTSDTDSLDRSSSPSQMDISTSVEPGTPARTATSPKPPRQSTQKPSALSSLLEFGTVPPSNIGDLRSNNTAPNPFPFPFVTPGPGVPFSPQTAAGMATFYRPPFGAPPNNLPLDMTQSNSKSSKKKSDTADSNEIVSQNLLDDSSSSPSPKKKAKPKARSKAKAKTNRTDGENGIDEDNASSSSPPPQPPSKQTNKKKRKTKSDANDNANTNDNDESKMPNGNASNHPHNLLAQMGLLNAPFMQPPTMPATSANGKTPVTNSQQAQQLAAMYSMAPHFAAYNAFPGAFNPAFAAAAYASGYPNPYGFHPAFSASAATGQPFPFMQPTPSAGPPMNNSSSNEDRSSPASASENRPTKPRKKSTTNGEKKKPATPRANKKKSLEQIASTDNLGSIENESMTGATSTDLISQVATTPESNSTSNKRRMSSTESEDFDEQQHSQATNGKSGNESDGSMDDGDRSLNATQSLSSSTTQEKKGARTTIKPQQLDVLCKSFESCSKPNKAQREQLVAETGLSLRVIQVWFQNKRSKERKGKTPKEKDTPLDDEEPGEDSQPSPLPSATTNEITEPTTNTTTET